MSYSLYCKFQNRIRFLGEIEEQEIQSKVASIKDEISKGTIKFGFIVNNFSKFTVMCITDKLELLRLVEPNLKDEKIVYKYLKRMGIPGDFKTIEVYNNGYTSFYYTSKIYDFIIPNIFDNLVEIPQVIQVEQSVFIEKLIELLKNVTNSSITHLSIINTRNVKKTYADVLKRGVFYDNGNERIISV